MTSTNDAALAAERVSLATILQEHIGDIEQAWLAVVLEDLRGRSVNPTDLRDAMPDYLRRLGESLRGDETLEASGSAAWEDIAREHAQTRVKLGFDIDQLVHEFIVLRRVISKFAASYAGLVHSSILPELIEAAIAISVKSYVETRDLEAARREAEHVAFITHELRNPLTTVTLVATALRRALPLTPRQTLQFEAMRRNLRRLDALIDGVLQVERFDAGKVQTHPVDVELGPLLAETLASAEPAARAKGLAFEVRLPAKVVVHVDPELTRSAVSNVIDNAVKYTDAGVVAVQAEDDGGALVLHVRDSGPGLSVEELQTIFEPFERGLSAKPGTGLGLAIARRAIEAQGGTLRAESIPASGSHFWMTLAKARQ